MTSYVRIFRKQPNGLRVDAAEKAKGAKVEDIAASSAVGEIIVWAVPGAKVAELAQEHAAVLASKIMIDATNKVGAADMNAISTLTALAPSARIFRAFSTLGWENFTQPQFGGMPIDLFFCEPDEAKARKKVEVLIEEVVLRPVYIGGLEQAPALDGLTRLWFALVLGQKHSRRLAVKMMEERWGRILARARLCDS